MYITKMREREANADNKTHFTSNFQFLFPLLKWNSSLPFLPFIDFKLSIFSSWTVSVDLRWLLVSIAIGSSSDNCIFIPTNVARARNSTEGPEWNWSSCWTWQSSDVGWSRQVCWNPPNLKVFEFEYWRVYIAILACHIQKRVFVK